MQAIGGEVRLTPRKGEGSRFEFSIDAPAVRGGQGSQGGPLAGKKIAIADDDPDLLELFRLFLSSAGCEVRTARDPASGRRCKIFLLSAAPNDTATERQLSDVVDTRWTKPIRRTGPPRGLAALISTPGEAREAMDPRSPQKPHCRGGREVKVLYNTRKRP